MLILRREAEEDIRKAFAWHEHQRKNLGLAFVAEIERALEAIEEHPKSHTQVFKSVRRILCRRFPYAIYFASANHDIVILAVMHQRRHPVSWKNRTW